MENKSSSIKTLDLNAQYTGAWSEINVRVSQRQFIVSFYSTLSIAVMGAALNKDWAPDTWRIIFAIPYLNILFIYLIEMHEKQIAILRSFLSEIEEFSEVYSERIYQKVEKDNEDGKSEPSYSTEIVYPPRFYHPDGERLHLADRARGIHDYMCIYLIVGTSFVSTLIVWYYYKFEKRDLTYVDGIIEGCILNVSAVVVIISIWRAYNIRSLRIRNYNKRTHYKVKQIPKSK